MKKISAFFLVLITVFCLSVNTFASDDIFTVTMDVPYGQTEARGMLSSINELRRPQNAWYWNSTNTQRLTFNNLQNLVYDYDLEQIAMQRAAEIALSFSHTRPDGTTCFTAFNTYSSAGENIAYGYTTAESVFTAWAEEDLPYSGQGHRRNMLSSNFTAVGIGHAIVNGRHCWVQEFRSPTVSQTVTPAENSTKTVTVNLNKNMFTPVIEPSTQTISLNAGSTANIQSTVYINNVRVNAQPTYSVANTNIAIVENGRVRGLSAGSTTLTISVGNSSETVTVNVTGSQTPSTPVTYTIKYNANGGTGTMNNSSHTYGTSKALNANQFTRTGYTFLGWSTTRNATTPTFTDRQSVKNLTTTNNGTVTLYAVWQVDANYHPSLTLNASATVNITSYGEQKYYDFTPSKSGQYVIYSTGDHDPRVYLYSSSGTLLASNDDGGDRYNFRLQYNLTAGTKYTFAIGYYSYMDTGSFTIKFGKVFNIKYNANGGSGAPAAQTKDYGTNISLSNNVPSRTGYTFRGWATTKDATTAKYSKGGTFSSNADTTLYAVWKPITYYVKYNANGGSGSMSKSSHTYGTAKALTSNTFTRNGYTFIGWSTSKTATTATYTNGKSVKNLTNENGKNITLYAVWKANTYTVKYHAHGGTGTMSNSTHTYGVNKALNANKFTRTGYIFKGWSASTSATSPTYTDRQSVKNLTKVNGKTVTLYAVWEPITYTVRYHAHGGTGTMSNSTHTYGVNKTLNANRFTRTGYTFLGWSASTSATSPVYTDRQSVKNLTRYNGNTVTLYAVWKPIKYTVRYNANGGTGTMADSSHTFGTAKALSANKFTKTGYRFLGWSKDKNATTASYTDKKAVSGLTGVNGKVVTLYAIWAPATYKVSYNANGGSGTMSNSTHTYGVSKALSANKFTRTGYTFVGWAREADATTAKYANKQAVSGLTGVHNKTVTLYAVWKKK